MEEPKLGMRGKGKDIRIPFAFILIIYSNSLPNSKVLVFSELKAFIDILKADEMVEFVLNRVENIVAKGENAVHQHFLLLQRCFHRAAFPGFV